MLVVEAVSRACKSQILSNVKGADGGGGGGGGVQGVWTPTLY